MYCPLNKLGNHKDSLADFTVIYFLLLRSPCPNSERAASSTGPCGGAHAWRSGVIALSLSPLALTLYSCGCYVWKNRPSSLRVEPQAVHRSTPSPTGVAGQQFCLLAGSLVDFLEVFSPTTLPPDDSNAFTIAISAHRRPQWRGSRQSTVPTAIGAGILHPTGSRNHPHASLD